MSDQELALANAKYGFVTPEEIVLISKAGGRFLIYGPASVEIVDDQGEVVGIDALKEAIPQLLKRHAISYKVHKDILVGGILEKEVVNGKVYKTEVVGDTLYVLAEIYGDNNLSKKAQQEIEAGTLMAYSISGQQIKHHTEYKDSGMPYNKIDKIDLFAVCICERGINPEAKFKILSKAAFLEKKVEQRGSQFCVIHCHGPDTGKPIKCFPTEAQAQAMHRAIQARKDASQQDYDEIEAEILKDKPGFGGGTGEGPGGTCICPKCGYEESHDKAAPCTDRKCPKCGASMDRKESVEKVDWADWLDKCAKVIRQVVPGIPDEEEWPLAEKILLAKQHPTHYGEPWKGKKPTGQGRADSAWMDRCMAKATFADNPAGFCNALWFYGSPTYQKAFAGTVQPTLPGTSGGGVETAQKLPDVLGDLDNILRIGLGKFLGGWFGKSYDNGDFMTDNVEKQEDGRPPKEWWDQCVRTVTESGSVKDPAAVCGHIYHEMGVRKPVKSGDVETATKALPPGSGKAGIEGMEAGNMPGNEGENVDKTTPPTLEEVDKKLDALTKAIVALPDEMAKKFPSKKPGEEEPPKKKPGEESEEDKKKAAEAASAGSDAGLDPEKVKAAVAKLSEAQRKEFFEKAGLTEAKPKPEEFKALVDKMSDEEKKEFLGKAGLAQVKPDPEQWKKDLEKLEEEDRKAFLEKAGYTVTETPRPDGALTDPKTGVVDEVGLKEVDGRVEKALEDGDLDAAFGVVDEAGKRPKTTGGLIG